MIFKVRTKKLLKICAKYILLTGNLEILYPGYSIKKQIIMCEYDILLTGDMERLYSEYSKNTTNVFKDSTD